jgi:hypothetical protein
VAGQAGRFMGAMAEMHAERFTSAIWFNIFRDASIAALPHLHKSLANGLHKCEIESATSLAQ